MFIKLNTSTYITIAYGDSLTNVLRDHVVIRVNGMVMRDGINTANVTIVNGAITTFKSCDKTSLQTLIDTQFRNCIFEHKSISARRYLNDNYASDIKLLKRLIATRRTISNG